MDKLPAKIRMARNVSSIKKRPADLQNFTGRPHYDKRESDPISVTPSNDVQSGFAASPVHASGWSRLPLPQASNLRRSNSQAEPHFPPSSQDPYDSSVGSNAGVDTTSSTTNPMQSPANASQDLGMPKSSNGLAVPDLSAMMFPSPDPFAYPDQPMTTLENRQFIKQEDNNAVDLNMFNLGAPSTTSTPYEQINHPMFGQLPPYMTQGDHSGLTMPNLQQSGNTHGPGSATASMWLQRNDGQFWPSQQEQRFGGTTLDSLYGEDWGGWMKQGYWHCQD